MTMPSDMLKTFIKPMHPEGIKFVAIFGLVTLLLFWLWDPLGWIGVGLVLASLAGWHYPWSPHEEELA